MKNKKEEEASQKVEEKRMTHEMEAEPEDEDEIEPIADEPIT